MDKIRSDIFVEKDALVLITKNLALLYVPEPATLVRSAQNIIEMSKTIKYLFRMECFFK